MIAAALQLPSDVAVRTSLDKICTSRALRGERLGSRVFLQNPLPLLSEEINREINRLWRRCVTHGLMTLHLPSGEIHLGKDLRALPGRQLFPSRLRTIEMNEFAYDVGEFPR